MLDNSQVMRTYNYTLYVRHDDSFIRHDAITANICPAEWNVSFDIAGAPTEICWCKTLTKTRVLPPEVQRLTQLRNNMMLRDLSPMIRSDLLLVSDKRVSAYRCSQGSLSVEEIKSNSRGPTVQQVQLWQRTHFWLQICSSFCSLCSWKFECKIQYWRF